MKDFNLPKGWSLKLHNKGLSYFAPSYKQASKFLQKNLFVLQEQAKSFGEKGEIYIHWHRAYLYSNGPFVIKSNCIKPMSNSNTHILLEQLEQAAPTKDLSLFKIIEEILFEEDKAIGICELESDKMLFATPGLSRLVGVSKEVAGSRNVRNLWSSPESLDSLLQVKQAMRQQTNLDNFHYVADLNPGEPAKIQSSFQALYLPERKIWTRVVTMHQVDRLVLNS